MKVNKFFSTPILLTLWRRPKETYKVIEAIRKVKPKKLFIGCDGPRKGNKKEFDKVQKTIAICKEQINWNCEVKWLISKKNLGCKVGVVKAINWFFKHVDEGIIMEDDNLAHPDFFVFCQELLKKYQLMFNKSFENTKIPVLISNFNRKNQLVGRSPFNQLVCINENTLNKNSILSNFIGNEHYIRISKSNQNSLEGYIED